MQFPVVLPLVAHPTAPDDAIRRVTTTVQPTAGGWTFEFRVEAGAGTLIVPPPVEPAVQPTDELWRHTCLEVFLSRDGGEAYREFNFSPSGQWAAYSFSSTRQRDPAAEAGWRTRPAISFAPTSSGFTLRATLAPSHLPAGPGVLRAGLSAVLETGSANRPATCSYWALKHPAAQPDFHHRDTFALVLHATDPA